MDKSDETPRQEEHNERSPDQDLDSTVDQSLRVSVRAGSAERDPHHDRRSRLRRPVRERLLRRPVLAQRREEGVQGILHRRLVRQRQALHQDRQGVRQAVLLLHPD